MVSRLVVIGIAVIVVVIVGAVAGYMYFFQRPSVPPKDYILVGFTIPLSGPLAVGGSGQLAAYQICADYINSQGGIYVAEYGKKLPIKLIYYDDSSDPAKARSLYEQLITQDKVDFLWPPFGTALGLAVVPIINKYQMPLILSTQTIGAREQIKNISNYIYVTSLTFDDVGAMYFAVLKKIISDHPELRRIAIIYPETDSPAGWARWTRTLVEQSGIGEIVFFGSYPLASTDVRGLLSRMADAKPDIVIANVFGADGYVVVSQMKELRINPKVLILAGPGSAIRDFYTRFDNATKEGIIVWSNWYPDLDPVLRSFWETYVNKYGYIIDANQGLAYKSCLIFKAAIEKAGTLDKARIKQVLDSETFDTPFGRIRFVDQIVDTPMLFWLQYQDGLMKAVFWTVGKYPNATLANAPFLVQYEYPKPSW